MYFPFRHAVCFAPDGAAAGDPSGEPAADQADQPETQQTEQTEQQAAAPEAAAQDAPAAQGQPAELSVPDTERAREDAQKNEQTETPEALRERVAAMQKKLGEYQLRTAAALSGVPKERIPYVMRMADVAGLDPSAADAAQRYQQAIDKVLADVPELRGAGGGTGSVGNFARKTDAPDALDSRIVKNIMG